MYSLTSLNYEKFSYDYMTPQFGSMCIVGASQPRRKLGKILYTKDDLRIAGVHTGGCIHSPGLTTTVSFLVYRFFSDASP